MSIEVLKPAYPGTVSLSVVRTVALFTFLGALAYLATGSLWILGYLTFEFAIRALYGPRFSPLAQLSIWITSRTGWKAGVAPGTPKRFAQIIGLLFSAAAFATALSLGSFESRIVMGVLALFTSLEAFFGFCAACWMFGIFMKAGVIPDEVCERCSNFQPGEGS